MSQSTPVFATVGKLLLVSATLCSSPAAAEMSLTCLYSMTTGAREMIFFCGEDIDRELEVRYAELRFELMGFINKNARSDRDRIGTDYDEKMRNELAYRTRAKVCKTQDYLLLKKFLLESLTTERIAAVRQRLSSPEDPSKGDCI